MRLRVLPAALLPALCLVACQGGPHHAAWSYEGDTGPAHWGDLDPAYAAAKDGREQSPIDIHPAAAPAGGARIAVDYGETELEVLNNGRTVVVDYHDDGTLTVGDRAYTLKQFHFHSPSEHTVDGRHAAIEMHLVHADASGELAVVGVLFETGAPHAAFGSLLEHLPTEVTSPPPVPGATVDADDLLPASLAAWSYPGSLTTPPCSEDVAWFVLREPLRVSDAQVAEFRRIYEGNFRPTQPVNGRTVRATH